MVSIRAEGKGKWDALLFGSKFKEFGFGKQTKASRRYDLIKMRGGKAELLIAALTLTQPLFIN